MPQMLHIRLLGNFSLVSGDAPVTGISSSRLQSLLAYLVLHADTPQPRQHLAFLFWPDSSEAQARNNLRQMLHALRLALPDADAFLYADTQTLSWRPDAPYVLDVAEFERAVALAEAAEHHADLDALRTAFERAAALYQADLLPGCYDEWIAPERERLRQRHLWTLDQLIQLLEAQHDHVPAIGYARRMIRYDALNEDAYRCLMHLLALKGDRAGALRVYHECAAMLQRELGIAPSPPTYEAYERLLRNDGAGAGEEERRPTRATIPSLIGRQREWTRLHEVWRQACDSGPAFVLLTGEAGIGKSRLAEDLRRWAGQHGAVTAKTRCYAAEGQLSLAPVTDWLRSDGLRPHLAQLDHVWLTEVARLLPELLTEYPNLPRYEPISEYGQRQRFFEALARAVLAAPQPLLLVIDDMQWCDQETLEWLHFLLRFDSAARLLVMGTARTGEVATQQSLRTLLLHIRNTVGVTEIPLQPLDAAETARLGALLSGRELNTALAMLLYRETEGNPLFIVETMRAGFDHLRPAESASEPSAEPLLEVHAPLLPPRVQAVIAARLAQLSPSARELAAMAAAIGREFRLDVLVRAGNGDEDSAVRALDELWQRRIVRAQGASAYDFTHDKLREVVYAEISAPQRHLLHRRAAQALEAIHASDLDPVSGEIASHFERAGLSEQAIPYYQRAAAVARRVYANEDAISSLSRGLALIERLPAGENRNRQELRLLLALAPIYRVTRGWTAPELERVMHRALALCDTVGDDTQRADALYGWQSLLVVQARLERVQVMADELRALYERTQRTPPPLFGLMLAGVRLHLGQVAEANGTFEQMIVIDDVTASDDYLNSQGWSNAVHARAWQSHALWCLGYPERALLRGLEAIQMANTLELPFNRALALTYLAMLQELCADAATAKAQAETARALTLQYQAPYYRAWSTILISFAKARDQADTEHLTRLRETIDDFKASGARLRLPYYLSLLARICGRAERIEEGLAVVDEALDQSGTSGERWWDAELHRLRGELMWAQGAGDAKVEAVLYQAMEIARAQQTRSLELRAATSLARLWRARGRATDARHLLDSIYGWFTEGFDTPDLRAAHVLLAELA